MDVQIEEMESVIHVTDQQSQLNPAFLERIVVEVTARLKHAEARDKQADMDRTYSQGITRSR